MGRAVAIGFALVGVPMLIGGAFGGIEGALLGLMAVPYAGVVAGLWVLARMALEVDAAPWGDDEDDRA